MDRTGEPRGRAAHRCRCSTCGAEHVRPELPLARYCATCFEWLPFASRAKYCSPACRRAARGTELVARAASDAAPPRPPV